MDETVQTEIEDDISDNIQKNNVEQSHKPKNNYFSYVLTLFVVFSIYFILSIYFGSILLTPISVKGASMLPTLNSSAEGVNYDKNTDIVYIYETKKARRQDIVVFNASNLGLNVYSLYNENESVFIKRVIAISGDKIQFIKKEKTTSSSSIESFVVYLNGKLLDEPYATEIIMNVNLIDLPDMNVYTKLINEEEIVVPENSIFVMGDNRNHSTDSREFGFVSLNDVIGVVKIHVPYGKNILYSIFHSMKKNYIF